MEILNNQSYIRVKKKQALRNISKIHTVGVPASVERAHGLESLDNEKQKNVLKERPPK